MEQLLGGNRDASRQLRQAPAFTASVLYARRAASIQPMHALRRE
jgi:hypothetical protein